MEETWGEEGYVGQGLAVVVGRGHLHGPGVVGLGGHPRRDVHLNAVVDVLLFDGPAWREQIRPDQSLYSPLTAGYSEGEQSGQ